MSGRFVGVSDEELVEQFLRGNANAFDELVGRYEAPLYNFVLRYLRDRDRARDVLQDAFMRAVERAEDFRGSARFSTWLYTIARNLCIDTARKLVHRRHASLDASTGEESNRTLHDVRPAAGVDAEASAWSVQIRRDVLAAVDALPDEQREVFLMREVQDLSFREIAEIVGAPENTVKSRMRYALERLQTALADHAGAIAEEADA